MVNNLKPTISNINYYLPKVDYSNDKIIKKPKNIKKIIKKIGINKKFAAEKNEFASDLAIKSISKLFYKNPSLKKEIDFLIYCTQSPDYFLPSGSSIIQNKIFPNRYIGSMDINLGCSGFVYSLSVAKGLLATGEAKKVLIVTSETYSKFISEDDTSVRSIFGDASSAVIVENMKTINNNIFQFDQGTDGSGKYDLIVPGSGLKKFSQTKIKNQLLQFSSKLKNNKLHMNGPSMFSFALEAVPHTINKVLKKNEINIEDIDIFILHQANKYMLSTIRDKMNINSKKFYIDLSNKGNTTSSTIPIALFDAIKKKIVKKNMKVLICGFGVGYSWATTIINIHKKLIESILE